MTSIANVSRTARRLAAIATGTALALAGCTADEASPVGSAPTDPVVDAAPEPEQPDDDLPGVPEDSALQADVERFCRAHDAALDAVDAALADDGAEPDALAVLIRSLEAVTSTLAEDLRAAGSDLHPRVEPLVAAAEQTAADAREALDADHGARHDLIAEQLAGASYLQPLVDDPDLYAAATGLAACADLPLGAVTAELRDADDRDR